MPERFAVRITAHTMRRKGKVQHRCCSVREGWLCHAKLPRHSSLPSFAEATEGRLRLHCREAKHGAGRGNRTLLSSLGSSHSTDELCPRTLEGTRPSWSPAQSRQARRANAISECSPVREDRDPIAVSALSRRSLLRRGFGGQARGGLHRRPDSRHSNPSLARRAQRPTIAG